MAARNEPNPSTGAPCSDLEHTLATIRDPMRKLRLYAEHLPRLATECPWLVADHVKNALLLIKGMNARDARVRLELDRIEADLYLLRAQANLLAHEGRMDIDRGALKDIDAAFERYTSLLESDHKHEYDNKLIESALLGGETCVRLHKHEAAVAWFAVADGRCGKGDSATRARIEHGLGTAYSTWDQLERALEHLSRALTIRERLRDAAGAGHTLHAIGRAYARAGNYPEAEEYMERARNRFLRKKLPYFAMRVVADLADLALKQEQLEQAQGFADTAFFNYVAIGDILNAARVGATVGAICEAQGEHEAAFDAYMKAYQLVGGLRDHTAHLPILLGVGRLHEGRKDLHAACLVYDSALRIAQQIGDIALQYPLHESLARVLRKLCDYQLALHHHERYVTLWQSVLNEKQQHELAKRQINTALRQAREERDAANNRAEDAERDLLNVTARLEEHNAMLSRLEEQVKRLRNPASDEYSKVVEEILKHIEQNRNASEDWKIFEFRFHQKYPEFARNLHERCPTLTQAEQEICYLVALGHRSEKIGAIRGTAPGTVLDQIRPVRKKLGLPTKVNFWAFMASLLGLRDRPDDPAPTKNKRKGRP